MNFQQSIEKCLKNYANFNGRATRSEYWFFILFGILVSIGTVILDLLFFDSSGTYSPLNTIAALALIIPQLSAGCRRLRLPRRAGSHRRVQPEPDRGGRGADGAAGRLQPGEGGRWQ